MQITMKVRERIFLSWSLVISLMAILLWPHSSEARGMEGIEDWEAAFIADCAYDPPSIDRSIQIGWERIKDPYNEDNGLGYSVYQRNSDKKIMISLAGTRPKTKHLKVIIGDWTTNLVGSSSQFNSVLSIIAKTKRDYGPDVYLTAHSKSGSLVQYGSAMTRTPGWAINTRPLDRKFQAGDILGASINLGRMISGDMSVFNEKRISKEDRQWADAGGVRILNNTDDFVHKLEGLGLVFFKNIGVQETIKVPGTRPAIYRDAMKETSNPIAKLILWHNRYSEKSIRATDLIRFDSSNTKTLERVFVDPIKYGTGEGHSVEQIFRATKHYSSDAYYLRPTGRNHYDARLMSEMIHNSKRVVVFGTGPVADKSYQRAVTQHGPNKVLHVHNVPSHFRRDMISARFRADSTMTIRESHSSWRETTRHGVHKVTPLTSSHQNFTSNSPWRSFMPADIDRIDPPRIEPQRRRIDLPSSTLSWGGGGPPPPPPGAGAAYSSAFSFNNYWPPTQRIGGVMLSDSANVSGDGAELGAGSFALLFEGNDAGMDIGELRQFVTALWAVYFSKEGPGISIDPIAPDIDKHIVRYIGHVVNSDLGRVMREADYTMKKWAVGTERPDFPGFRNPDDIAGQKGMLGPLAWSRFWFVPEDMRFRKSGNMLLFDGGRMTLRTEYLTSTNLHGKVDKANEQFAAEFTANYPLVAEMYPEYKELFEYAKMVSLAKYLKNNGVPMLWYLLSNKDMILTEDSTGTVDALATKSKYFQDVEITGGVDLAAVSSSDHYVIDEDTVKALAAARKRYGSSKNITMATNETIVFKAGEEDYTLVTPQSLALSESAVVGENFQTDIAIRLKGEPALELARYYNPKHQDIATFGYGWHLMIPYRLKPEGEKKIPFLNLMIPERMAVENLLSGRREVLTFSQDRYSISGYVPTDADQSGIIGLFWLTNGSLRLADKLGSEFQFDSTGRLTDMILTNNYIVNYKYGYKVADAKAFQRPPLRIEPVGKEHVTILNAKLPKYLRLLDALGRLRESFVFAQDNKYGIIGYSPASGKNSNYRFLSLLSNGSFQLEDQQDRLIKFNSAGQFDKIQEPVVKSFKQGEYQVVFDYQYLSDGFRIAAAHVIKEDISDPLYTSYYQYTSDGRMCSVKLPSGNEVTITYKNNAVIVATSKKMIEISSDRITRK